MESVDSLSSRRQREGGVDFSLCFICQTTGQSKTSDKLRKGTSVGLKRIQETANERAKYNDTEYIDVLDRIQSFEPDQHLAELQWHGSCYSDLTNMTLIKRLQKRFEAQRKPCDTGNVESNVPTRRSSTPVVDWNKCLFCQEELSIEKLHNIMVMRVSEKILTLSQFDSLLRYRLSGINDLIAAEGKYHLKCYVSFVRKYSGDTDQDFEARTKEVCLNEVCDELNKGLARGEVFTLPAVWKRYGQLIESHGISTEVYRSNRFKDRIMRIIGSQNVEIIKPLNIKDPLLLFPKGSAEESLRKKTGDGTDTSESHELMETYFEQAVLEDLDCEILSWLYRVAVKVKSDIQHTDIKRFTGKISIADAETIVPESLYILLKVLCTTEDEFEQDISETNQKQHSSILSIAQDVVALASKRKIKTPKQIGLGMTVHQATRSKELVRLLHAAGHSISYEEVLRYDTSIAHAVLEEHLANSGVIIPSNFMKAKFCGYIRFANDNIDINEETLDGTGTFHASQTVAFRKKDLADEMESSILSEHTRSRSLKVPEDFMELIPAPIHNQKPAPIFAEEVLESFFLPHHRVSLMAKQQDFAWFLTRAQDEESFNIPGWSGFNQQVTMVNPPTTVVGNMPIIKKAAHDFDTIWTVMQNCQAVTKKLGQQYTVITFDEQLYCKAKMLQWQKPDECRKIVIMLGGFHIQLNFAKVIGKHMEDFGLKDILIESQVYGENTATNIMNGKSWNRIIRAHKLVYEALMTLLWRKMRLWMAENDIDIGEADFINLSEAVIGAAKDKDLDSMREYFAQLTDRCGRLITLLKDFDEVHKEDCNYVVWRQYMDMIGILLRFTRAAREGNWSLYVSAFSEMLPWMSVYDHINYLRWGTVFVADMKQLHITAPEVEEGFTSGDFVVKETAHLFNQIPDDLAMEHCNKIGKVAGGLVGITRIDSALNRWCLTYNERSRISDETGRMLGMLYDDADDEWSHKECGPSRLKRDKEDICKLREQFERFGLFEQPATGDLVSLTTGDVATEDITKDMVMAHEKGKQKLFKFVSERLVAKKEIFHETIHKVNSKTMSALYKSTPSSVEKTKSIKSDRELFRRLIVSMDAGRSVDIDEMLDNEMSSVPLALASSNGNLRPTNKALLADILSRDAVKKEFPVEREKTCIIVDGMALVQAIGKPQDVSTFGEYADTFKRCISSYFNTSDRVDVVFDRYQTLSIKATTRAKRTGSTKAIRRKIQNRDIKMPENWRSFVSSGQNKSDIASFLSTELQAMDISEDNELVVSGGFPNKNDTFSSTGRDTTRLEADHEEADTRILLHARDAKLLGYKRTVVVCKDTDVLVMLTVFADQLSEEIFMNAGTQKKPKIIHINAIILPSVPMRKCLLAFHALTGCDSTSQFAGITKKSAWHVYEREAIKLDGLGSDVQLENDVLDNTEDFVCKLYKHDTKCTTIHDLRCSMFRKCKTNLDMLPPTKDALVLHIKRAHFQALVWNRCLVPQQDLPSPTQFGWEVQNDLLQPTLASKPQISKTRVEVKVCHCTQKGDKCRTRRCMCVKNELRCTGACGCDVSWCENPFNQANDSDDSS